MLTPRYCHSVGSTLPRDKIYVALKHLCQKYESNQLHACAMTVASLVADRKLSRIAQAENMLDFINGEPFMSQNPGTGASPGLVSLLVRNRLIV